jgi:hypothetical protein
MPRCVGCYEKQSKYEYYECEECGSCLCEECDCPCEPNEIEEEIIVEVVDDPMDIDYYWDDTLDLFVEI